MRSVERPAMPASLCKNAELWTKELADLQSAPNPDRSRIKKCQDRYRQPDVQKALEQMYQQLCCYCESRIGVASYGQIEHRKPKSEFPALTFDWGNLHWACQICNQSKGKKWDDDNPILDSVRDCVAEHLSYRKREGGPKRWPESDRGKTTVIHADLNRQKLIDARAELAKSTENIQDIRQLLLHVDHDPELAERIRDKLRKMSDGEYGSFVSWLILGCSHA